MTLDEIDRKILALLRLNARRPNRELASEVGLSQSACLRRVKLLEQHGVIRGYTLVSGGMEDDRAVNVIVQVTLDRQTEDYLLRFETALRNHPEIRECFLMTGAADYWLRVSVETAADYERVHTDILSRLPGVARIQSNFAMRSTLGVRARSRRA